MSEPGPPADPASGLPSGSAGGFDVWRLMPHAVAFHVALPALMVAGWRSHESLVAGGWVFIHVAFPVLLAITYPSWRGQGEKIALMVLLNHVVTLLAFFGLALLTGL